MHDDQYAARTEFQPMPVIQGAMVESPDMAGMYFTMEMFFVNVNSHL
jgi:hypothetical protein